MKSYIGCKIIKATYMTNLEYEREREMFHLASHTVNKYKKGEQIFGSPDLCSLVGPKEAPEEKAGYKVMYPDGYVSWSPKQVFEQAYRLLSAEELLFLK